MATIFVDVGEALVVDILDGTVSVPTNWFVGWGTGSTTAVKGDSAIETESAETRVQLTMTQPSANITRGVGTITSSSGQTIANAGMMTLVSSGVMIVHGDFTGIVLANGDKIEFTIDITWS